MILSRLVLAFYLTATLVLMSLPPANWGQVRPLPDPDMPSYLAPDQVSGKLTLSLAETMKPLVRAWVEEVVHRHPKLNIAMAREGSDTGLAPLLAHRSEVAAMARRMTADEIAEFVREYGYEPTEVPVATDALAVYVHKDNPLTGLSLDELDAMFCRERHRGLKYVVDSWGLVGVMDEWFETPVQLYGRNGKSGPGNFFREEICKGGTLHPQLLDAQGLASVVLEVGTDPNGIGFSAIGYRTPMVKPVPIAMVKGGRYVEPSLQAVMDASYPLRRNLYLYIA
ncbi:MAG: substrate-binding domain-containing protein, partial [Nitrospira sp.]|nr:substrate-binding domain-containing protein [Nitrospira sp.]